MENNNILLENNEFLITLHIIKNKKINNDDMFMDIANILDVNGYNCIGQVKQTETVKMKNGETDIKKSCRKHGEEILSSWK